VVEDLKVEESDLMTGRPDGLRHPLHTERLEP
jgi:hypothetical protein